MEILPYTTLILNTVGEPGSGKTTLSFWLSQALKKHSIVTEFVPEVVKYECFDPKGKQRVASGRFDRRYFRQQIRWVRPLLGRVEVLINDGCLELSYFYAQRRMATDDLAQFKTMVDTERQHWAKYPSLFLMPQRQHAYETDGRNETEEEAQRIRHEIQDCLHGVFEVDVQEVGDEADRERLLQQILGLVMAQRKKA